MGGGGGGGGGDNGRWAAACMRRQSRGEVTGSTIHDQILFIPCSPLIGGGRPDTPKKQKETHDNIRETKRKFHSTFPLELARHHKTMLFLWLH